MSDSNTSALGGWRPWRHARIDAKINAQGMSNCSDFLIKKEDHTIGNLVAEHLKHHPHVMMAGYKGEKIK